MHGAHSDLRCEINELLNHLASRHERLFSQADSLRTENEMLRARLVASRHGRSLTSGSSDSPASVDDGAGRRVGHPALVSLMGNRLPTITSKELLLCNLDDTGGSQCGVSDGDSGRATPQLDCDASIGESEALSISRTVSPGSSQFSPRLPQSAGESDAKVRFLLAYEDAHESRFCAHAVHDFRSQQQDYIPDERQSPLSRPLEACGDHAAQLQAVSTSSTMPCRPEKKKTAGGRKDLTCETESPSPRGEFLGLRPRPSKSHSTLQSNHAITLEEVPLWTTWAEGTPTNLGSVPTRSTTSVLNRNSHRVVRGGDTMRSDGWLQHLVLGPSSKWRFVWDILSVLAVAYDVLTVPLIAFGSNDNKFVQAIRLATTAFWTADIPFTFLSGFHVGGIVEMRPRKLAQHYIKRWFCIDLVIVVTDWMLFFLQAGFGDAVNFVRITKTMRLSRILRLFRLLRVAKVPTISEDFSTGLHSETLITVLGVARSLLVIVVVNHFIACGWYAVGRSSEPSWTEILDLENRDTEYRYLTSLHWSLTQFTPASMEIAPRNSYERGFAIVVLFSALVSFSTFISSITNAMTTLRRLNAERSKQSDSIRRYIADNRVSLELGNRITTFLRTHNYMAKKRVHEADIQIFKVLPESLRLQLHWEVYMPLLTTHPFFHHFCIAEEQGIVEICHTATSEIHLATCQELFHAGQVCNRMYFLLSGVSEFTPAARGSTPVEVSEGAWFCEACLWVRWTHRGKLHSVMPSELIGLDSARFRRTASFQVLVLGSCCAYARMYQAAIAGVSADNAVDMWCDFDRTQEMAQTAFEAMEFNEQNVMDSGEGASAQYAWKLWRSWSPHSFVHGAFGNLRTIMVNRSNTA